VPHIEAQPADHEMIAVANQAVRVLAALEPFGLPVGAALGGCVHGDAALGELARAGKKIGVNVGFCRATSLSPSVDAVLK
jgi:hypothetical protein